MITPQHDTLTSRNVHLYAEGTLRNVSEVKKRFNQENQATLLGLLQPEDAGTPLEH